MKMEPLKTCLTEGIYTWGLVPNANYVELSQSIWLF